MTEPDRMDRMADATALRPERLERELAALREERAERERIDDLIAKALGLIAERSSTRELLREIVSLIAERTGMEGVGLRLREGEDYPYFQVKGFSEEFVRIENSLCPRGGHDRPPIGENGEPVLDCVCGGVIQGRMDRGEPFCTEYGSFWSNGNSALVAERPQLLGQIRGECIRSGYESSALIPLRFGTTTHGLLQLEDKRTNMFTPELLRGLERIAMHLSLALSQRQAVEELRQAGATLESRVQERTAELQREIAERARVEEALRQAKETWELTFASVPDLIVVLDERHRVLRANPAMAASLGCDPEQCVGLPCYKVAHGLDAPPDFCPHSKAMADGHEHSAEVFDERLGGHFLVSATPMLDDEGRVKGSVHVARDVTQLKRTEEALRQAKQEAEQALDDIAFIVEATDLGLWTNEWPMREMNWNRQVKSHFWLPPDHEPILDDFFAALRPEDREPVRQAIAQAVENRSLFDASYRVPSPDGGQRWVRAQGRAFYGEDGRPLRFSGITQDVTVQKRLEEELRRARLELEERVEERTRELALRNQELQDFAYIASHDLQEPLRKIQAFGQRLREEHSAALEEEGMDFLQRMERAASRMQTLINDLLDYSRVTTRTSPFQLADLAQIAREATLDLDQKLEETGGTIEIGELPWAEVDPVQMRQVFQNLFSNALKYRSEAPPMIKAEGFAANHGLGEAVRITVRDNGIGFDEQFSERIFQPFQRLHGKNSYQGTGIGLAIVRKIVERHGGTITARSAPGRGSAFTVELPRRRPEA